MLLKIKVKPGFSRADRILYHSKEKTKNKPLFQMVSKWVKNWTSDTSPATRYCSEMM